MFGQYNCIKLLIKNGANIKSNVHEAIRFACYYGYNDCAELLIKYMTDINIVDYRGNTVLHDACLQRNHKCVALLLQTNIDVNLRNFYGKTALDLSIENDHMECINLLRK
jgi:ankyrin repeat protein